MYAEYTTPFQWDGTWSSFYNGNTILPQKQLCSTCWQKNVFGRWRDQVRRCTNWSTGAYHFYAIKGMKCISTINWAITLLVRSRSVGKHSRIIITTSRQQTSYYHNIISQFMKKAFLKPKLLNLLSEVVAKGEDIHKKRRLAAWLLGRFFFIIDEFLIWGKSSVSE